MFLDAFGNTYNERAEVRHMFGSERLWAVVAAAFFVWMLIWSNVTNFENNALGTLVGAIIFAAVMRLIKFIKEVG